MTQGVHFLARSRLLGPQCASHGKRRRWLSRAPLFQLPPAPVSARTPPRAGLTLIELLVVIAVIGALAALTLNVASAAQRQAAAQQARAELAVLASALEAYRRQFGAYPTSSGTTTVWAALHGRAAPSGAATATRSFIDPAAFRWRSDDPFAPGNEVIDPWGQPYRYRRFEPLSPDSDYIVYSIGPDGRDIPANHAGVVDFDHPHNRDNLYAHRE